MAITVQEATDADIARACEIETAAYGPANMGAIFFPGPFPSTGWSGRAQQIISMRRDDPTCTLLKAVDEDTGEQIAFAKWNIYGTPEAAASAPVRPVPTGPGVNEGACKAFFGGLVERKQALMGTKPHICMCHRKICSPSLTVEDLHMLHTDPNHQRRGAASALLKWGTQKADDLKLPVYLESSSEGHILYGRHQFKTVEMFEVNMKEFGADRTCTAPLMIRDPVRNAD